MVKGVHFASKLVQGCSKVRIAQSEFCRKSHHLDFEHSEVDKATFSDLNNIKTSYYHCHGELTLQRAGSQDHGNPPNNCAILNFLKIANIDFDHSELDKVTSSDLNIIKTSYYHCHGEPTLQRAESQDHGNPPNNCAIRNFLKTAKMLKITP